jgi:hypothetical protein
MSGSPLPKPAGTRIPSITVRLSRSRQTTGKTVLWWLLPVAFLVVFYRDGLSTWFVADDFAWLSLLRLSRLRHDLLHELFAPMAQGTIRPWSERGFFMLLESIFGLDALPFRLVVFATAAADVILISWITLRATGSRVAGFIAPLLWTVNTALVLPMTWDSTFNEVLCPLFLLGALALYIRYLDTGQGKFWWWQLVVFSLGFGALEINIVYPAIAAAWVLFQSRDRKGATSQLITILPQAAVSILYFLLHRLAAPIPASGPYTLFFDRSVLKTLALYWQWSLVPQRFGHGHFLAILALLTISLAIAAFVATELLQRRRTVLFFLSWFAITLTPVLPLTNHRTDYYLTIPFIGLAMLGAAAACQYWNRPFVQRAAMVIPLGFYLFAMIPVTRAVTHWWLLRSLQVRTLVLGVIAGRETHPGKAILLDGVTTDLYNLSFTNSPFFASDINGVYLSEESAVNIHADSNLRPSQQLVPAPEALWHAITHDEVVVYSFESDHLRNITEGYARQFASRTIDLVQSDRLPSHVDIGNTLYSWLLGPAWLPPEDGVRWMPGSATLRMGVPAGSLGVPASGTSLKLEGSCPRAQLLAAPRHLMVLVDGILVGDTRIYDPESDFRRLFPMPAVLAGKKSVEVEIRVDPVDRKDGQDYGLVFGNISIKP